LHFLDYPDTDFDEIGDRLACLIGPPAPLLSPRADVDLQILGQRTGSYVLAAIDAFSPSRCMFASNFPVDAASYGYGILWNEFKRVAACYLFDEQRELFHDTAARVYRLPG
jgi:hypothetical protein